MNVIDKRKKWFNLICELILIKLGKVWKPPGVQAILTNHYFQGVYHITRCSVIGMLLGMLLGHARLVTIWCEAPSRMEPCSYKTRSINRKENTIWSASNSEGLTLNGMVNVSGSLKSAVIGNKLKMLIRLHQNGT